MTDTNVAPAPSENKAVDIVLAAFPGSEVVSVDRNKPIVKQPRETVMEYAEGVARKPPPKHVRKKKGPVNMDGMFDA